MKLMVACNGFGKLAEANKIAPLVEGSNGRQWGRGGDSKLKKEETNGYFEVMKLKKL